MADNSATNSSVELPETESEAVQVSMPVDLVTVDVSCEQFGVVADESDSADCDTIDQHDAIGETLTGYELVESMMRRQDEVLNQLDDLNLRIEAAIAEISASRKSELAAMEAAAESDTAELPNAA